MMLRPNKPIVVESDIAEVVAQLERGALSQGQIVATLEDDMRSMLNRQHAIAFSSATSAFDSIFEKILSPGDEVIISPFTFKSVPQSILRAGGKPVFIDIAGDFVPDWVVELPSLINENTRAIVITHIFGYPDEDLFWILRAAKTAGIYVIEDCAQSLGSTYSNQGLVGNSASDFAVFSFYATKNVTGAEGGIVVTDYRQSADDLIRLRNNERILGGAIGTNRRMSNLHAALAHSQLVRLKQITSHRNMIAGIYRQNIVAPNPQLDTLHDESTHCFHQYTVVLDHKVNREVLINRLKPYGIECGIYYDYLINYDSNYYDLLGVQFTPIAYDLSTRCVSLPIGVGISYSDAAYISNYFNEVYNELSRA